MIKTYCFWFKFCCLLNFATAQQVENAVHWQSASLLSFSTLAHSVEDEIVVGGVFKEKIEQNGRQASAIGGSDIFIAQLDENGGAIWLKTGGSEQNDELEQIIYANDQIYATGTYWIEGQFDSIRLQAKKGSKSIFLLNYSTQGDINWGISIDGTSSKNVSDLVADQEGNLLLSGSFTDSLILNDTLLQFSEQQSFFLIKLDKNGEVLWSKKTDNIEGIVTGVAIGISEENRINLTGNFIGKMQIEEVAIETNTEDNNVFLASFSKDGDFLWLQAAGGVFPDEVVGIQSIGGQIFLTGNFFGRLQVSENIIIESVGLNENIFLLAYEKNGQALWAKNIGEVEAERVTSLDILGNQMVMSGFFREGMKVGDLMIEGDGNALNGFLLSLDGDGNPLWLSAFNSDQNLLVNEVQFRAINQISVIGDFIGNATLGNFQFEANTFNPFLAKIKNTPTSTQSKKQQKSDYQIINNQTSIQIITTENIKSIQIFDLQGRLLRSHQQEKTISIANLSNGIYLMLIYAQNGERYTQLFTKLN